MYLAEDKDGNLYVLAMNETDFKKYNTQWQYFFYGKDPDSAESVRISGKVEKVDRDIKKYTCEYINYLYDDEMITVSTYEDLMGAFFLNTNVSATSYGSFFWGVLVGIISLILVGLSIYQIFTKKEEIKNIQKAMEGSGDNGENDDASNAPSGYDYEYEIKKRRTRGIAILVGIVGAVIGALIPIAMGIFFEFILWYAVACIPLGFALGYGLVEKGGMTVPAKLLNIIVSTALGFSAMYVIYAWVYFKSLSNTLGHISFFQAFANLIPSLSAWKDATTVYGHLAIGTIVALVLSIIMSFSKNNKN